MTGALDTIETSPIAIRIIESDRQTALILYARHMLTLARTVPELLKILQQATVIEVFVSRMKCSVDVIGNAHRLKIEALTKLGSLLKTAVQHEGGRPNSSSGEPFSRRTLKDFGIDKKISYHAQQLASMPSALQEAVASGKTSIRRAIILHRQTTADRPALPLGKYRVLLADPPWPTPSFDGDYVTMSVSDIAAMPIKDLAADSSALFMWTTAPLLPQCFAVIDAWGFEYKTNAVWDKQKPMFGHYLSTEHEHLMLCTRGSCQPDRLLPLLSSVIRIKRPRTFRHSQKPDEVHDMVERLFDGPYLELFARRLREGWTPFGNDPALDAGPRTHPAQPRSCSLPRSNGANGRRKPLAQ